MNESCTKNDWGSITVTQNEENQLEVVLENSQIKVKYARETERAGPAESLCIVELYYKKLLFQNPFGFLTRYQI